MQNTTIDVRPVASAVGAEIHNVDLTNPLQDRTYQEIRNALNEHGVIFFRDQNLTPAQHLAFTARFGEVEHDDSNSMTAVPGFPMIGEVRKEPEATRNIGGNWHSDHSFDPLPPLGPAVRPGLFTAAPTFVSTGAWRPGPLTRRHRRRWTVVCLPVTRSHRGDGPRRSSRHRRPVLSADLMTRIMEIWFRLI